MAVNIVTVTTLTTGDQTIWWDGAVKVKQNVSPVVKNSSSTHLSGNLHADYLVPSELGKRYGEIFRTMLIIFCSSRYNYLGRDNKRHFNSVKSIIPVCK